MADFTFTIPDDKLATVRDAICENQGWDSYRRELQGLTDRLQAQVDNEEISQATMDDLIAAKVAKIGPALNKAAWAKWRIGLWIRGQVQKYQRKIASDAAIEPVGIDTDIATTD